MLVAFAPASATKVLGRRTIHPCLLFDSAGSDPPFRSTMPIDRKLERQPKAHSIAEGNGDKFNNVSLYWMRIFSQKAWVKEKNWNCLLQCSATPHLDTKAERECKLIFPPSFPLPPFFLFRQRPWCQFQFLYREKKDKHRKIFLKGGAMFSGWYSFKSPFRILLPVWSYTDPLLGGMYDGSFWWFPYFQVGSIES